MNFKDIIRYLLLIKFLFISTLVFAQTTVSGVVIDAGNKQPLPFVTVTFTGSTIGVNSNNNGKFVITSQQAYTQLKITYLGYKDAFLPVLAGKQQVINVKLFPVSKQLSEVTVKSTKNARYTNKDNPAVALIRKVIANKPKNKPQSYDYVEYKEYDKMQFSISNLSQKVMDKKFFRKYKFVLENRDSATVPGKSLLPIFLTEKLAQVYYRKNPEKIRDIILGQKSVNFGPTIDNEGLSQYFKHLYEQVDIYDNNIMLLGRQFMSPIADGAPNFYKFFITDTITTDNNTRLVELNFTPRNTNDIGFEGIIFITLDGNYGVQKDELTTNKNINVNFVRSLHVDQEFELNPDGRYHLSKSSTLGDFGVRQNGKGGLFGIRTFTYKNYVVNKPQPEDIYIGTNEIASDEVKHRSEQFWRENRLDTLTTAESKVYKNIDSLTHMPSFRRTADIATLLFAGYKDFGPFELGPASTFYSFNPIEGLRLRLGGRTTPQLSKRIYFETYGAYGFNDEKWKYFFSTTYSFNNQSIYKFPQNYIRASFQRDAKIPGQSVKFIQEDNFLLSFKRGTNDKYLYNDFYKIDYVHEYDNHLSYKAGLQKWTQTPTGTLYPFLNGAKGVVNNITATTATFGLRYAPYEEFFQGKLYRTPIINKYPILSVDYTQGFKGLFGGDYNYQSLHAELDKRFYLGRLGFADFTAEAGQIFGKVPYPLLTIHRANQTYAYLIDAYNLMNFLEFVSDHYSSVNIDQHFGGYFFNRIPLFKKLKWRETASVKALWGGVYDRNNPSLHPDLLQYPVDDNGRPITYTLGSKPYVEGSVGIENIFKFIRVDLVRRFNYLDHPEVAGWGIRTRVKFDF